MKVTVITPPGPVVTWEEADAHLRLDGDVLEKGYVESLIAAATAHIDGPAGWLGRAIGEQELDARFSLLASASILLPYPPVVSLVSVKYLDRAGSEQTASNEDFELFGEELVPVSGSWPWEGGSLRPDAGRVRYRAGYETVPAPIKQAILLMVGDLHYSRASIATGPAMTFVPMSTTVEALLAPYRIYS